MKNAVSLFVIVGSLLTGIHDASASSITSAISVETTMGRASSVNDIGNIINQTGLIDATNYSKKPYISGVTDFDEYINSSVIHNYVGIISGDFDIAGNSISGTWGEWFAGINPATAKSGSEGKTTYDYFTAGSIIFDLGTNYIIDRLALWNEDSQGIKNFNLSTSIDKTNWTFNTSVERVSDLNPINTNYGEEIITLATISIARYVKIDVLSSFLNATTGISQASIGEVAFSTSPVPEPTTLLLLGTGLVGLLGMRRRNQ